MSALTHRSVLALAGPMIISNVTVPLLGLVDTAVVGHMDSPVYLGAVAVGGIVFGFLFWGFGFLRMGTTGLTAQSYGNEDGEGVRAHLARGVLIALLIGALLIALQVPIFRLALTLIDASDEVTRWARAYLDVRIWAAPFTLTSYVFIGWLLGTQDARGPMIITIVINVVNIVLDVYFVVALDWGVVGVARASLIAEITGVVTGALLVRRKLRVVGGGLSGARLKRWDEIRRTLAVNRDIMIRTLLLIFAFAFFTRQGARYGDAVLAANAVLLNFQDLMAYVLDGFAHAAEALVGRAVGQRSRERLDRAVRLCAIWSLGLAVVIALAFALSGPWIIDRITDLSEVRSLAREFLPWVVASPLVAVWSFLLDGVFIGATRTRAMRDIMAAAVVGCYLPVWYLAQPLGNHGLWLAMLVFLAARGVGMAWAWRGRARWLEST